MRFIDLGVLTPEQSVLIDDVLLRMHSSADDDVLLLYSRDRPCISVGRFQRTEHTINSEYVKKNDIAVVRRCSGGSNIYSDERQLTYSLIISKNRLPPDRSGSFAVICNCIVQSLRILGINCSYKPVNDILVNGKKISGGAQSRTSNAILQHGSLILDVDNDVVAASLIDRKERSYDGLTSMKECLGHIPSRNDIADALISGFSKAFGPVTKGELNEKEIKQVSSCSYR
ncbi:MAG: lipoate--protein ligase family protein [Methanomassiliicoccaceae archaeon]|nr:lipoate--protein ligase family protein [Methanomassiliicoccaceae archaeon]